VRQLDSSEHYQEISLDPSAPEDRTTLDDVFIRLVRGANDHCIPMDGSSEKVDAIDECRKMIMASFFDLFSQRMKGLEVIENLDNSDYANIFRVDIRDKDHTGYWILPCRDCDESEFERFQHVAWRTRKAVDDYWNEENFIDLVVLKRSKSRISSPKSVINTFDGTFEGELAELAVPAAGA
jgi:hypothetical protein